MREQIAGVENAGVSRMERQPEILLRQRSYFVILILILVT